MADALNTDWKYDVTHDWMPFCEQQLSFHQAHIRKCKWFSWAFFIVGLSSTIIVFIVFRGDPKQISDAIFKLGPLIITAPIWAYLYRMKLASKQAVGPYSSWKRRLEVSLVKNVPPPQWVIESVTRNMDELTKPRG
jgi:hypothetical protein